VISIKSFRGTGCFYSARSNQELVGGSNSSNVSSVSIGNIERGNNMLQKIPSRSTDFRSNHPGIIQVHMTNTKKDLTGAHTM
jgi:hypothetical protein